MNKIITEQERNSILANMETLLDEYGYNYSFNALHKIIDEWALNKAVLIKAFKKHPNYIEGKFMIAFDKNFERKVDIQPSKDFSQWLRTNFEKVTLPKEIEEQRIAEGMPLAPMHLYNFLMDLHSIAERTISEETANLLDKICPQAHAHAGQKTSRVVNKLCCYLGFDKITETVDDKEIKPYNREFAKYADSLNPLTITRHTVLSINPIDYLTMSFGNSWSSCHTIDKTNKRGMPNSYEGCYSSGTMSYLLDPSSMVFYTVDSSYNGDEYYFEPKINRQMFHYGDEKLVQSRLYPQSNDHQSENIYKEYRNVVQQIIAEIFDLPNYWTVSKGTGAASGYIEDEGTHYRDYESYDSCTLSRLKGSGNAETIYVGHEPICIECGYTHSEENCISCCSNPAETYVCQCCGNVVNEDDVRWVDGDPYCLNCVEYCDSCDSYHVSESYYVASAGIYVCQYCFDEWYAVCDDCGECYHIDDMTYIECEDRNVCNDCLENYRPCAECGYLHNVNNLTQVEDGVYLCPDCNESLNETA